MWEGVGTRHGVWLTVFLKEEGKVSPSVVEPCLHVTLWFLLLLLRMSSAHQETNPQGNVSLFSKETGENHEEKKVHHTNT
jgi:hypothetical protein